MLRSDKQKTIRLDKIENHFQNLIAQGLSACSVRFVHLILHKSLNDVVRRSFLGYNPAHLAMLPRYDPPEMAIFDDAEVVRFLIAN